ncbi:unnamed protein product [Closterium sp. NIES-53]
MYPHVAATGQVAASCSCTSLSHPTVLWYHHLGNLSLPRLRNMASQRLVLGLPHVFVSLPPSHAPSCTPCVEGLTVSLPPPLLFLAPIPPLALAPPVNPPPPCPAPFGVSHATPLSSVACQVAINFCGVGVGGAGIGGASSAGAGGEGAGARGASSEGAGAEGTDTGGASSWGAGAKGIGTRGATFGGARVGGADTGGASFGGACFGGVGAGGAYSKEIGTWDTSIAAPTLPPHRYPTRHQTLLWLELEEL